MKEQAKEKAIQLYTKFQVYSWDEERGYIPDDDATKKIVLFHIDEVIGVCDSVSDIAFYIEVKTQLKNV